MKIVFDVSTPKQVRFFKPMIERLRARGCQVSAVTRAFDELDRLRQRLRLGATTLGRYGGAALLGKLLRSSERVHLLARHFERVRPDLLVTLSNVESARAAFGLSIPVVCFLDLPESEAVSRLTLPLATRVCAPWIIPKRDFQRYGVSSRQVYHYRALDPLVWLRDHEAGGSYRARLGIDPDRPLIVARESEWQSPYVRRDVVNDAIGRIARRHRHWQVVSIPRYRIHPIYDVPSLLAEADLLVGGGGTMCIEAAYYGTPVVATRQVRSRYMQWLCDRGLAVAASTVADVVRRAETVIGERGTPRARARRAAAAAILRRFEFPLDDVVDLIIRTARREKAP